MNNRKGKNNGMYGRRHTKKSRDKMSKSKLGKHFSIETEFKKGHKSIAFWKGKRMSEDTRKKMSDAHMGRVAWNKGLKGYRAGEKSHLWRGGITPMNMKIRKSLEYKLWREAVFARDNYTCAWCGQHGGKLNADHIKKFADYPELRFALDNGRTLCEPCHKKTDTYGNKK